MYMLNVQNVKLQYKHLCTSNQFFKVYARQNVNSRAMCGFQLSFDFAQDLRPKLTAGQ